MKTVDNHWFYRGFASLLVVLVLFSTLLRAAEPRQASCRITNYNSGMIDGGSGTLVDIKSDRSKGLILTCAHIFDDGVGKVTVIMDGGYSHGASLYKMNKEADLSLLVILNPKADPVGINLNPQGQISVCGYGSSNTFQASPGNILGSVSNQSLTSLMTTAQTRSGDSGGGVFDDRGNLVAVHWGKSGSGFSYGSHGEPFKAFLQSAGFDCRGNSCIPPGYRRMAPRASQPMLVETPNPGPVIGPIQPLLPPNRGMQPVSRVPDTNMDDIMRRIEELRRETSFNKKRLERLEKSCSDSCCKPKEIQGEPRGAKGDQGESGIQGIQGEKGERGETGKTAEISSRQIEQIVAIVLEQLPKSKDVTEIPTRELGPPVYYDLVPK